jgi:signal transduction histidine kinase
MVSSPWPRRWLVDAGLAAAVLVAAEIAIAAGRETGAVPRDWFAYLLGVAMGAPVLLRRRRPMVALGLVAAALLVFYTRDYPGFPPAVVLAVPLYDATQAGHPWRALPVPGFFLTVGMVVALGQGLSRLEVADVFLPQAGLVAVAMLLGALIRSRRAYTVEAQQRLRAVAAERERAAEQRVVAERLRIARELHDTVTHAISTITVQSGSALYLIDREPARARDALAAIRRTSKDALAEMRAALGVLRGEGEPLAAADRDAGLQRLPELLTAVRAAGLDVTVDDTVGDEPVADEVGHAAYRIVQESLTNVLRHAGPSAQAEIRLARRPGGLDVAVWDDGAGADEVVSGEPGGGHGLAGMAERAQALGGLVEAGPRPEGGFAVRAWLPLAGERR